MRLAAIAKNIKASGVCGVHYVGPLREVWIMTAHGIYRLNGYPKPIDRDETAMMFGIGPKTMENIAYNDFTDEDATWLEGYNLTDSVEGEIRLVTMDIDVSIHGQELRLLTDEQKNVIAIATADDLAPLQGEFASSAYMAFYLRTSSQGEKYIVIKDGFSVRAAIMQPDVKEALRDSLLEALTLLRVEGLKDGTVDITRQEATRKPRQTMTRTDRPRETYGIYIDVDFESSSERVNKIWEEKCERLESICAYQEREIYLLKRKIQNEQEKAEISKAIADQQIAVLTQQLEKKKKHRTLGDRVLQIIGFWVGIIYWLENMDGH